MYSIPIGYGDYIRTVNKLNVEKDELKFVAKCLGFDFFLNDQAIRSEKNEEDTTVDNKLDTENNPTGPEEGSIIEPTVPEDKAKPPKNKSLTIKSLNNSENSCLPNWDKIDSLKSDNDSEVFPKLIDTLFEKELSRSILVNNLSLKSADGDVDIEKLVDNIVNLKEFSPIPKKLTKTLRNGLHVVVDVSEGMELFMDDQDALIAEINKIVPKDNMTIVYEQGCPIKTEYSFNKFGDNKKFEFPQKNRPILLLSDLGLSKTVLFMSRSYPREWIKFVEQANLHSVPVIAFVPYSPQRWPAMLKNKITIVHWDRGKKKISQTVKFNNLELGNKYEREEQFLNRNNEIRELANVASITSRIEPQLIRKARIRLFHWAGADVEVDFWYGPLAHIKSSLAMVMNHDIAEKIREDLRNTKYGKRLELYRKIIKEYRKDVKTPAIYKKYDEMIFASTKGEIDNVDSCLYTIFKGLKKEKRYDLADWVLQEKLYMDRKIKKRPLWNRLFCYAAKSRNAINLITEDYIDVLKDSGNFISLEDNSKDRCDIGFSIYNNNINLSNPPENGNNINIPNTDPPIIFITSTKDNEQYKEKLVLKKGEKKLIDIKKCPLEIYDLDGNGYCIDITENDSSTNTTTDSGSATDSDTGNNNINDEANEQLKDVLSSPILLQNTINEIDRPILFVDKDICDQWGIASSDLKVLSNITLDIFIKNLEKYKNDERFQCVGIEDIFCESVIKITFEDAFPGAKKIKKETKGITIVPPLKREVADFFSADYLSNNLEIVQLGSNIEIKLSLKLKGLNKEENGENFIIKKIYENEKKEIMEFDFVQPFALWPNLSKSEYKNDWKAFYTYFSSSGSAFEPSNYKMHSSKFYIYPYTQNRYRDGFSKNNLDTNDKLRLKKIIKIEDFPEILVCSVNIRKDRFIKPEFDDYGLFFLNKPTGKKLADKIWDVGIDINNTDCSIIIKSDKLTRKLLLENSSLLMTKCSIAKDILKNEFLYFNQNAKGVEEKKNIKNMLYIRDSDTNLTDMDDPVLEANIFTSDYRLDNTTSNKRFEYGLKWGNDSKDKYLFQIFIKYIVLIISAEAVNFGVKTINWHYPYLYSLSPYKRGDYKDTWFNLVNSISKDTGLEGNPNEPICCKGVAGVVAYAAYCKNQLPRFNVFYNKLVCIYIGDETTDISIWDHEFSRKEPLLVTSVDLSINDIFFNVVKNDLDFFELTDAKNQFIDSVDREFDASMKKVLLNDKVKLCKKIRMHLNSKQVEKLRNYLCMAMTGLLFYVGHTLRFSNPDLSINFKNNEYTIFIGGVCSQILYLMSNDGKFHDNCLLSSKLLKPLLVAGALEAEDNLENFDESVHIVLSDNPGYEIAEGLVSDNYLDDFDIKNKSINKTSFNNINSKILASANLSEKDLKRVKHNQLEFFQYFLRKYYYYLYKFSDQFTNQIKIMSNKEILNLMKKSVLNKKSKLNQNDNVDPVFILGLKVMLNDML